MGLQSRVEGLHKGQEEQECNELVGLTIGVGYIYVCIYQAEGLLLGLTTGGFAQLQPAEGSGCEPELEGKLRLGAPLLAGWAEGWAHNRQKAGHAHLGQSLTGSSCFSHSCLTSRHLLTGAPRRTPTCAHAAGCHPQKV